MEEVVVEGRRPVVLERVRDLVQRQAGDVDRQRLVEPEARAGPEAEEQPGGDDQPDADPDDGARATGESGNLLGHGPHGRTRACGLGSCAAGGGRRGTEGNRARVRRGERGDVARYITKRLVLLIIIILFVSVASFFLVHLLPGNPTDHHPRAQRHRAERRHASTTSSA